MSDQKITATELTNLLLMLAQTEEKQYRQATQHIRAKIPEDYIGTIPKYSMVYMDEVKTIEDNPGELNMTGQQYISQTYGDPRARYKHMRGMLQEIWNIQYKHPNSRFDIDGNFGYDPVKIAHYIYNNASVSEINQAHETVRAYYQNKGRGRPKGARNREKVVYNHNTDSFETTLDEIIDDLGPVENEPKQIEAPKINGEDKNFSSDELERILRAYVTHTQLGEFNYVNVEDLKRVAVNLETALRGALIEFEKTIKINQPTIVELKRNELPNVELGVQHRSFTQLLQVVNSCLRNGNRIIPWVYGPAGTGKSVAAENVAKALDLECYVMGTTLTKFEVTGFINTTGYQTTPFREAYEHGGVFCADEMDSWAKEATVALNNGLANSSFTFPDKKIKRHPNFVMIVCANTTGAGATLEYVGRNKLDGATLNRFVHIYWPLDEALEDSICSNKDWLAYVRRVRANVARSNLNPKPLITPRATIFGESLLNSGMNREIVVDMCLRQGLSETQWNTIK